MKRLYRVGSAVMVAGMLVLPSVGGAQERGEMRVFVTRAMTPFEQQVEALARQLSGQQELSRILMRRAYATRTALGDAQLADSQRVVLGIALRNIENQMAAVEISRARLRRELTALCPSEDQPEGWAGVTYSAPFTVDVGPRGAKVTRFSDYPGVESIEVGSPAEKAGIMRGDRLVSIGDVDLRTDELAFRALLKPGARLPVRLLRGVETKQLTLIVESRPASYEVPCAWLDEKLVAAFRGDDEVRTGATLGVLVPRAVRSGGASAGGGAFGSVAAARVQPLDGNPTPAQAQGGVFVFGTGQVDQLFGGKLLSLNPDLAKSMGVSRGILVVEVSPGSSLAAAGIRAGDVLVSADGNPIASGRELVERVSMSRLRELKVQLVRQKKTENATIVW